MGLWQSNKGKSAFGVNHLKVQRTIFGTQLNNYRLQELTRFRNVLDNIFIDQMEVWKEKDEFDYV